MANAITIETDKDSNTPNPATAVNVGTKRVRDFMEDGTGISSLPMDDEDIDDDEVDGDGDVEARLIRVKQEKLKSQSEERFEAEAAYERGVWPDASAAGTTAQRAAAAASPPSCNGTAAVSTEITLTAAEVAGGRAEKLPKDGQLIARDALVSVFGARAPAATALCSAPSSLLDVSARVCPLHETVGGETQLRKDAACVRVEARLRVHALSSGAREGHAGAERLLPAFIRARQQQGGAATASEAGAEAKLNRGICLPPRAIRNGKRALRSLRGILDALETEGTASPTPSPPLGLADGVCLSEYQFEALGWMLARERSAFALEDLFETSLAEGLTVTTLPGGGVTLGGSPRRPRHRGGILAEEMGMGKTVEVLACVLSNPAPTEWRCGSGGTTSTLRRAETLVIVPSVLLGQWRDEIRRKAPGLVCVEWAQYKAGGCRPIPVSGGSPPMAAASSSSSLGGMQQLGMRSFLAATAPPQQQHAKEPPPVPVRAAIVLATFADARDIATRQFEWWRVVCDEPHGELTATPRAGRIETAAAVPACAAIASARRWCMTGTPFTNSLYDVFGQLVFLRIIGGDDTGRHGSVGCLPALHFRLHLDGGGRWQATCNDSAEVVCSLLKPLVVRHTKAQTRNGQVLLALQPCTFSERLVEPTEGERAAYVAACAAAKEERASGVHRTHEHAHALRAPLQVCAGLLGELGSKAARMVDLGLGTPSLSSLATLASRVAPNLPQQRDDFRIGVDEVPSDELVLWQDSVRLHDELSCASCLARLSRPVALRPCGHLLCSGCADDLLTTASEPRDVEHRAALGIRFTGHEAFPPECLSDDLDVARAAKDRARDALVDRVHAALRGAIERARIEVEVSSVFTEQVFAVLHLPTAELESIAASELNQTVLFDHPRAQKMSVGRHHVPTLTCPCPAPGCAKRFAQADLLDITRDVVEHPSGTRWHPRVREFVVAATLRRRNAKAADALTAAKEAAARTEAADEQFDESSDFYEANVRICDLALPAEALRAKLVDARASEREATAAAVSAGLSCKPAAAAQEVVRFAAAGERAIVFVDHALLVTPMLAAIKAATVALPAAGDSRPLRARGIRATTKRQPREEAIALLHAPIAAGGLDALVLTLRAGAVGLNLSAANHIIFASPCLDASVRRQAVGRCHRMGQSRPVTVTTLAVRATVEEVALGLLHRDDLPTRYAPNGSEITDQYTLRLAEIEACALGPGS